jgi:hypothetical protein
MPDIDRLSIGKGKRNTQNTSGKWKGISHKAKEPSKKEKGSSRKAKANPIWNRIIVCCDGAFNPIVPTNVYRLYECLGTETSPTESDPFTQFVHYQPGIGAEGNKFSRYLNAYDGRGTLTTLVLRHSELRLNSV